MRFWFAPSSEVPLYRQLVTQVQLAIFSGELHPGDRLPSTRELARRFAIHPNTVSAGYRELERAGWTELRHGSGVYVCNRTEQSPDNGATLDLFIANTFREARRAGLPMAALRARLAVWLAAPPPDRWLLIDADAEVRSILLTEIAALTQAPVAGLNPADCGSATLAGAVACCRPSQQSSVRACLPEGAELVVLPITSTTKWLGPWLPAPKEQLIAVVSHWPEFLSIARSMLAAAGVPGEALLFRDARQRDWCRGLVGASGILCDTFSAKTLDWPRGPHVVVFPLLAEEAREMLQLPPL